MKNAESEMYEKYQDYTVERIKLLEKLKPVPKAYIKNTKETKDESK